MKKPMTKYKAYTPKAPARSFVKNFFGMAYAEKGVIKTYTSRTKAKLRLEELTKLGYDVVLSNSYPFVIYLNPRTEISDFIIDRKNLPKDEVKPEIEMSVSQTETPVSRANEEEGKIIIGKSAESPLYTKYEKIFKRIQNCNNSEYIEEKFKEEVEKNAFEIIESGIKKGIDEMIKELEQIADDTINDWEIPDEDTIAEAFADVKYQEWVEG